MSLEHAQIQPLNQGEILATLCDCVYCSQAWSMGETRTCSCAELGKSPLHGAQGFKALPQPPANPLALCYYLPLSGRLIHSYPSDHSSRICWVGFYQLKNDPLGNSARHQATHSFAPTFYHNSHLVPPPLWFVEVLGAGPCARHRGYRTKGLQGPFQGLWSKCCNQQCLKCVGPRMLSDAEEGVRSSHFQPVGGMG